MPYGRDRQKWFRRSLVTASPLPSYGVDVSPAPTTRQGAIVALVSGSMVNLSLGIFYAWSVFADALVKELGFTAAQAVFPYTLEMLVFSIAMIAGGRFQDRFGPRRGIVIAGWVTGLSLAACALVPTPAGVSLLFGVVYACAAAFGYSAVTPTVIRWFPPSRRGLVTGIVVMSMGAGALVWAPVVNALTTGMGVVPAFVVCGAILLVSINVAARGISLPAAQPARPAPAVSRNPGQAALESGWRTTIRSPAFRVLWLLLGLSTAVGSMFIANLVQIAELQYGIGWGYLLVSLFAACSAAGRVVGGAVCDHIGYISGLRVTYVLMASAMLFFLAGLGWPLLIIATILLGLSYGSVLSASPIAVAGLFGLVHFGTNFGILFTALGFVGSLGPSASALLAQFTGSYRATFVLGLAAALLCLGLVGRLRRRSGRVPAGARDTIEQSKERT